MSGVWTDSYTYEWILKQDSAGNISGSVQNTNIDGCDVNFWTVTGSVNGTSGFTLTATIPTHSVNCSDNFTYVLTFGSSMTTASGPWTNNDGVSGFVTMTQNSATTLTVTSNGTTLAAGDCASISADNPPKMPTIVAQLDGQGLSGPVNWQLKVTYSGPDSPPTSFALSPPLSATVDASAPWTVPFGSSLIGGDATLTYTYSGSTNSFGFCIDGTNPDPSVVKGEVGPQPWYAFQIAEEESIGTLNQFDNGEPEWTNYHGFGIMQVDPPLNPRADLFSWKQNISDGKLVIRQKAAPALTFWTHQVGEYNAFIADNPLDKTRYPPPADKSLGNGSGACTFSWTPTVFKHPFFDASSIQAYNGTPGGYFISWHDPADFPDDPGWVFNIPPAAGDPKGYVDNVCSFPAY